MDPGTVATSGKGEDWGGVMGHHINDKGQFQSDKYPDLPPNKIVLSFKDKAAVVALHVYVRNTTDRELADDIFRALMNLRKKGPNA